MKLNIATMFQNVFTTKDYGILITPKIAVLAYFCVHITIDWGHIVIVLLSVVTFNLYYSI